MPDRSRSLIAPRPSLGLPALLRGWRRAFSRLTLRDDALAGLGAIGASFALALLVGVHAGLSTTAVLVAATLGSAVVALVGGTTLGLSGPGLAMVVVAAELTRAHGAAGLALACGIVGVSQVLLGALGVGRFGRLAPLTAVHAFTFGLGAVLVIQSLPHVVGLNAPLELDAVHVIDHLAVEIRHAQLAALPIAALACVATVLGARYAPRVPVALLVIAIASLVTGLAGLEVPTLPDLPVALPVAAAPDLPGQDVTKFVKAVFVLFAITTMETLLSASAEEESVPGVRNDPDQELIGHGVANMMLAVLGGVPVAGSIVRAALMRRVGAETRLAALIHAIIGAGFIAIVLIADHTIPLAALAGVVIAVAAPLLDPRPLLAVARISRAEAIVLAATAFVIVFSDLWRGVQTGLVATLALALWRVARFRASVHEGVDGAPHQVSMSGPITFLSVLELDRMRTRLALLDPTAGVILDVRSVLAIDVSGAARFLAMVGELVDRGGRVAVLGASPRCTQALVAADVRCVLEDRMAVTQRDVDTVLGQAQAFEMRAHVIANLERFRGEMRQHYTPLFDQLADGQHPHTLFVTCVDSRVSPAMFTGAHPGDLFILRCLGAMVAPPGGDSMHAEGAAVEYAMGVLGVRNIVICGHSQCGAIKAVRNAQVPAGFPTLARWLADVTRASGDITGYTDLDDAARAVTVRQLVNLRMFPAVREQLDSGRIRLFAWFFDVAQAELFEWDEARQCFAVLGEHVEMQATS